MSVRLLLALGAAAALAGCIPRAVDQAPRQPSDRVYPDPRPYDGRRPDEADVPRQASPYSDLPRQPDPYPAEPVRPNGPYPDGSPQYYGVRPNQAPPRDLPPAARAPYAVGAAPRPVWEARPVTADAHVVEPSTYFARAGESLARVGERTGVGAAAIARANGLSAPVTLREGQRLMIPGGRYHLIAPGQSGIAIARAYGVSWSRIVDANGLVEPYVLRVGQRILIPDGPNSPTGYAPSTAPTANAALADRAAAFQLNIDDILTGGEPAQTARAPDDDRPMRTHRRPRAEVASDEAPTAAPAYVASPARLRGGFIWPVDGRVVKRFGPGASGERNDGVELAVPSQTPVRAAADGVVAYVGSGIAALGGLVIIKHGDGWTSVYGHAARLLVRRGDSVRQGQPVALSGSTGFADRPELHFELRKGRTPVDPQRELPRI